MGLDNSRLTFDPWNDVLTTVQLQGNLATDADLNEGHAAFVRRMQAGTLDTLGHAAYPATTPDAFRITLDTSGAQPTLKIGAGRMYVDGLLAENHGDRNDPPWDPALAELSGAPQPPPAPATGETIGYDEQPYYPNAPVTAFTPGAKLLAYLDVWERAYTWLYAPDLVDRAIGIPTSARLQTVWQVRVMDASDKNWGCPTPDSEIFGGMISAGRLSTGTVPTPDSGPCCLTTDTGYIGPENQLYRVEIHTAGAPGGDARFKWSRENASVETGITAVTTTSNTLGNPATQLTVLSLGRDDVLSFKPGNWVELLDDALEFGSGAGEMVQIDSIDLAGRTVTLTSTLNSALDMTAHPRMRRWDQSGKVYRDDDKTVWHDLSQDNSGTIPVPTTGVALILEDGVTVTFELAAGGSGLFNAADFWSFAARTVDGWVEPLKEAPPRGIHHHYTKLSIVTLPGEGAGGPSTSSGATDCRTPWNPSGDTDCGCCSYTVGDGVESHGQYTSINAAIDALHGSGGEVCILPGRYFEHVCIVRKTGVVLRGCGPRTRIASPYFKDEGSQQNTVFKPLVKKTNDANTGSNVSDGDAANGAPDTPAGASGLAAVITVAGSREIRLENFAVEAAKDEIGILLDWPAPQPAPTPTPTPTPAPSPPPVTIESVPVPALSTLTIEETQSNLDVAIQNVVVIASTRPAIAGNNVRLLLIERCRVGMQRIGSMYAAICLSGNTVRVERNWVSVMASSAQLQWIPPVVIADYNEGPAGIYGDQNESKLVIAAQLLGAPGGVQIAGPSTDVRIIDNEIENGTGNGITLGNFILIDKNGNETGGLPGATIIVFDGCCNPVTHTLPGATGMGAGERRLAAGGPLRDVLIERNHIHETGMSGIGPVGYFQLAENAEVISITNLQIRENVIARTLQMPVQTDTEFGYGAISLPDVQNLGIVDNVVSDFGLTLFSAVCGIFVLHAQCADIRRNRITETRDWTARNATSDSTAAARGGIVIMLVTPPDASASGSADVAGNSTSAVFEPGVPALRIEHNIVRTPFGLALGVAGFGPFTVTNNHFGTGMTGPNDAPAGLAATVEILNFGTAIDSSTPASFTSTFGAQMTGSVVAPRSTPSSGTVLFTSNICQLEDRLARTRNIASIWIGSFDSVICANNVCWVDTAKEPPAVTIDLVVIGGSVQVNGNRMQEEIGPRLASGVTLGVVNVTCQNVASNCLYVQALVTKWLRTANNIQLSTTCPPMDNFTLAQ